MKKKILALLMVLCMICTLLPTAVFAESKTHEVNSAESFAEAISTCSAGDTIKLMGDVTITSQLTISKNNVTLDGNGKTIYASVANGAPAWSADNDQKHMLLITGDGVTLKDVTIDGSDRKINEDTNLGGVQFYTAENGTVNNITIKNVTGIGLNINASTVDARGNLIFGTEDEANGSNNGINVSFGENISNTEECCFDASEADINGVAGIFADANDLENGDISICVPEEGWLFAKAYGMAGWAPAEVFVAQGFEAAIGTNAYATLSEAIAAADDGDTVNLLKDVVAELPNHHGSVYPSVFSIEKNLTLDGNNHSITVNTDHWEKYNNKITGHIINVGVQDASDVDNYSVVATIKNFKIIGDAAYMRNGINVYAMSSNDASTKLTLNNVSIENCGAVSLGVNNAEVALEGTCNIANGGWGAAVALYAGSTGTISAGTYGNVGADEGASLAVTGGTFANDPTDYIVSGYVVSGEGPYTVSVYVPPYVPPVDPTPTTPEVEAPSVDTDAPVVDSTTTENEDGSTTKSETLENGAVVETTTNTDGSSTSTATKTDIVETEESKTTTTTTVTTNTSATGETVKESTQEVKVENVDGSATTTTTTVTETEKKTEKTEVKEETVVKEDGTTETKTTATTETALSNGSTGTTTTDETGKVDAEVTVSAAAVQEAAKEDKPIDLPMPAVEAAKSSDEAASGSAATVTVTLPAGTASATVAIPVAEGTGEGTVAVIVNADGTETVITESVVTENGLEVEVPDGATVKVIDKSTSFNDTNADAWYNDAVDFNSAREIMNGVGNNEFAPDETTTRAMVWTMLARLSGVDTSTGETWDEVGRQWAMENGISDGTMANEEITREQLATMLHRYVGAPDSDHDLSIFPDHEDTSDWAKEAKQWAVELGVINGMDGMLNPTGDASRAQVAQMIMNFIKAM